MVGWGPNPTENEVVFDTPRPQLRAPLFKVVVVVRAGSHYSLKVQTRVWIPLEALEAMNVVEALELTSDCRPVFYP